jgi:DNA-binding response OmpR family regulator
MVLDIIMPDLSGFEVLQEIRSHESTKEMPVIIHSSKTLSKQESDILLSLGAFIYPKRALNADGISEGLRQILEAAGIGQ